MTTYHPLTKKSSASPIHESETTLDHHTHRTLAALSPNSDQTNHLSSSHTSTKSQPHLIPHLHAHSAPK